MCSMTFELCFLDLALWVEIKAADLKSGAGDQDDD